MKEIIYDHMFPILNIDIYGSGFLQNNDTSYKYFKNICVALNYLLHAVTYCTFTQIHVHTNCTLPCELEPNVESDDDAPYNGYCGSAGCG